MESGYCLSTIAVILGVHIIYCRPGEVILCFCFIMAYSKRTTGNKSYLLRRATRSTVSNGCEPVIHCSSHDTKNFVPYNVAIKCDWIGTRTFRKHQPLTFIISIVFILEKVFTCSAFIIFDVAIVLCSLVHASCRRQMVLFLPLRELARDSRSKSVILNTRATATGSRFYLLFDIVFTKKKCFFFLKT